MDLAENLGVQFTFFLSVGRSISRRGFLQRKLKAGAASEIEPTASLSARHKLGNFDYIKLALLNPNIGKNHLDLVRRLSKSQEVGLHGGRNHDVWHHGAQNWSSERLNDELNWALTPLRRAGVEIKGFSCPGWTEPPLLTPTLMQNGFQFRADLHGPNEKNQIESGSFINLATNILGEPGGVAFLENLIAQKLSKKEIREVFAARLSEVGDCAVTYDHPYFAGLHALDLVEDCVKIARDSGYTVMPLGDVALRLRGAP